MLIQKINLAKKANGVAELFQYVEVGKLNNHTLNVLNAENRTLDFHVHEHSDELFYVIDGAFWIELDGGIVSLAAGEMIVIPRGTRHRPVVRELVKVLLIELDGTLNPENTGGAYARSVKSPNISTSKIY